MFLEKFVNDKTHAMLLKELGSLSMDPKEKVKDFNQRFSRVLKIFSEDTKPRDSITKDYYTSALPTSMVQFIKWTMKPPLSEYFEEEITV